MDHWTAKEGESAEGTEIRIDKTPEAPVDIAGDVEISEDLRDKENVRSEARAAPEPEMADTDMGMDGTLVVLEDDLVDGPEDGLDIRLGSPTRPPAIKRGEDGDDDMGDQRATSRR